MIESQINDYLKVADSIWQQIIHSPSHILLVLLLNVIGVVLKILRVFSNRLIPVTLILIGGAIYPLLVSPMNVSPDFRYPGFVLIIYGVLLGAGSVVVHALCRKSVKFRQIEAAVVDAYRSGDTQFIHKPTNGNKS